MISRKSIAVMPWEQIKALRNIVAHRYGAVDTELMWEIINGDIPDLRKYCIYILGKEK